MAELESERPAKKQKTEVGLVCPSNVCTTAKCRYGGVCPGCQRSKRGSTLGCAALRPEKALLIAGWKWTEGHFKISWHQRQYSYLTG